MCLGESRAWRDRDKLLVEQVHSQWGGLTGFEHDLDPNADLLMVVDAYNEKKNHLHQRGPQASLVNEIVRYFGATIPSVVLQTADTQVGGAAETRGDATVKDDSPL